MHEWHQWYVTSQQRENECGKAWNTKFRFYSLEQHNVVQAYFRIKSLKRTTNLKTLPKISPCMWSVSRSFFESSNGGKTFSKITVQIKTLPRPISTLNLERCLTHTYVFEICKKRNSHIWSYRLPTILIQLVMLYSKLDYLFIVLL